MIFTTEGAENAEANSGEANSKKVDRSLAKR